VSIDLLKYLMLVGYLAFYISCSTSLEEYKQFDNVDYYLIHTSSNVAYIHIHDLPNIPQDSVIQFLYCFAKRNDSYKRIVAYDKPALWAFGKRPRVLCSARFGYNDTNEDPSIVESKLVFVSLKMIKNGNGSLENIPYKDLIDISCDDNSGN